ncbi:MAG: DUF6884 domain-containing protein [Candidatus Hodarchaeales archaeon]|jgi:hypothetical protein
MSSAQYLLIISCGKKKSDELMHHAVKAKEAYKGPMFQVINKAKREERWPNNLNLGIISAKYGFLRSDDIITYYDLRMTKTIAKRLNSQVIESIRVWHEVVPFSSIYVLMGKDYLATVHGLEESIKADITIENMGGLGIGQQKLVRFLNSLNLSR